VPPSIWQDPSSRCRKSIPERAPRLMHLGLRVAYAAAFHGCDLTMFKTLDIMKEEEKPIARRQRSHGSIEGHAVNNASLPAITSAKTTPDVSIRDVSHHLIE